MDTHPSTGTPRHTLVVMRHAKSDWSGTEPDHERGLTRRGTRQAGEAGAWLAGNVEVDLAVVSTAKRARRTWELVAAELGREPELRLEDRLYGATVEGLVELVRGLPETAPTVLLLGHNPDVEDLVEDLTGWALRLTTSAIAVLDVAADWAGLTPEACTLRTHGRPPVDLVADAG